VQTTLCTVHTAGGKKNVAISAAQQVIYSIVFRQCIVKLHFTIGQLPGFARVTHLKPAFSQIDEIIGYALWAAENW
jgi:hypothetical protein